MDFTIVKSTKDMSIGVINIRYTPSINKTKNNIAKIHTAKNIAEGCAKWHRTNDAEVQSNPKRPHDKRIKFSLGITISIKDWEDYISKNYNPQEEMKSLGITFDKFSKFMEFIRMTVEVNINKDSMKLAVQSAMMKLIAVNNAQA